MPPDDQQIEPAKPSIDVVAYLRQPQTDEELEGAEEITKAMIEEEPW